MKIPTSRKDLIVLQSINKKRLYKPTFQWHYNREGAEPVGKI
jgi:hypothetical protein